MTIALTLLCACASAGVEDAGSADATVTIVDTGVRPDSGGARDSGALDASPEDASPADADPIVDATPGDAGPDDAQAQDALPGDATSTDGGPRTGPLTLVFEAESPFRGAGVAMFNDATGALRATRTTTVGLIVEPIEEGWMVTISNTLETPNYLYTITEVAPGETYRVAGSPNPPEIAVMTFAIGDPYPGAATYWFETGCFGARLVSSPTEVSHVAITDECTSPSGTIDYAVVARDGNLNRLAFKLREDVPVVANSTVTITDPWRTDFSQVPINVSNAPVGADYVGLDVSVSSNGAEYDYDRDNLILSGGAGAFTLVRPPFGEGLNTRYDMIGNGLSSWLQKTARAPLAQTFDLSVDFLPFPGPVTLTVSPVIGRPTASWPAMAGLDFIELQVLSLSQSIKWSVIVRGAATSFAFPQLPVELAAAAPTDLSSFTNAIRVIDADSVADYAAARAAIGTSVLEWSQTFDVRHQAPGAQVRGGGEYLDFD